MNVSRPLIDNTSKLPATVVRKEGLLITSNGIPVAFHITMYRREQGYTNRFRNSFI